MSKENEIQALFDKYLAHRCSPEEIALLVQLLQEEEAAGALSPRMEEIWEAVKKQPTPFPLSWETVSARMKAAEATAHAPRRIRRRRWRYAAAAAVLAVLVTGSWLWWNARPTTDPSTGIAAQNQPTAHPAVAVAPGGNRAVLTLSGGKQIALNTAANGMLATQSGSRILKVDSGLLAYHSEQQATGAPSFNTLSTPRGGQFQLLLPDGTKVWLNAASSIRFPSRFTGKERSVALRGEAYFEVAPRAQQPFIVHGPDVNITVLGTAFNVKAYPEDGRSTTTLISGKVRVDAPTGRGRTLQPGQQVIADSDGKLQLYPHADIAAITGWKNGLFVFHNSDIQSIMQQLARWYDVDVVYEQAIPATTHFTGAVRRQVQLSEVLHMLELAGNAHFKTEGRTIKVSL